MGGNGEVKQDQINSEQLNKETFEKVKTEITELTDGAKDSKDKIEGLDGKLTSGFFEYLKKPENNQGVKDLYDAAKGIQMEDTNTDKTILNTIITFLEPIANPINLGQEEVNKMDSGGKIDKFYNGIEKSKTETTAKITDLIANIDKANNPDLAKLKVNLEKINKILSEENPKKEDVQSLQKFLENNLNGDNLTNFKASSFNKKGNPDAWDGKFGQGTMAALNIFVGENTIKVEGYNKAKSIAAENDIKNNQAEVEKKQEQIKIEETNIDNKAQTDLGKSDVTYSNIEQLNKEVYIEGGQVKYRGESKNIFDLSKNNLSTGGQNFNGPLLPTTNVDDLDQGKLNKWKDEVDKRLDKDIITYDDKTNEYKYKGESIKREDIGGNEGQKTLENRQNEVDKKLISDQNQERSSTTEVSTDKKTTRKIIDFVGDNGQKIVTEKQNDDLSSSKIVDVERGEREKVITTEFDKEGNIVNKTKVKEDGNSFKEKSRDKDLVLKDDDKPAEGNEFVIANADDIISAIKDNINFSDLSRNYEIKKDGDSGINIDIRKGYDGIIKGDFLKSFEGALKNKGIVNLDMKNYKFKGEKNGDKDIVTKLSFNVGSDTKKEIRNPEFEKMDQIKDEGKRESIAKGVEGFEYSKFNGQMFARTKDQQGNYQYQKFNSKNNTRENQIDPYLRAVGDEQQSNNLA